MRQLLKRRVPQILGAYFAGSWILLEFTDWAVDQYALSPVLTNFVVTTLLLLLPAAIVLAWRHGAPGADEWTKVDAAVIGLNLVAAGGILMAVFSGQELGAATTVRLLEDDAGNTVERVIPKAEFRRDVLVWDFDNESGDPELDWLESGLWMGLIQDVSQDLFVTPVDPTDPRVREPLNEAGFTAPHDVPLALKRRLAESRGVDHFLTGEISGRTGDTLVVRTRLYRTRNARMEAEHEYRGTDPLELADRMSLDLRRDLGIPDWHIEESVDLPSAEMFTNSREALRAFSDYRPALFENRLDDARAAAEAATEIDSTFAAAYGSVATAALLQGNQEAARDGIASALRHSYRLPERARLVLQMLDRMLFNIDPAAALQTGSYWTELYPQDPVARQLMAQTYAMQGDMDGMINQYQALLAIDSLNVEAHQAIAAALRQKELQDSALVYYRRLADLQPNDIQTKIDIANTEAALLRYEEARAELERARIAAPDDPSVLERLASLDLRQGMYEDAARRIEEMEALARTAQERSLVAGIQESYFYGLGQYEALRQAYLRRAAAVSEYAVPIQAVQIIPSSEALVYAADWGREAFALQQVDSIRATVEPPWSYTLDVPAVQIYLDQGNVPAAREALDGLRALDAAFGEAPGRQARIVWAEGRITEIEDGDCGRALDSYRSARELAPQAPVYRAWEASCLVSLDRPDEARENIDWLMARLPGNAKVRVVVARYHAARGETEEAIAEVETALRFWSEADSDFRPAIEARELLAGWRMG